MKIAEDKFVRCYTCAKGEIVRVAKQIDMKCPIMGDVKHINVCGQWEEHKGITYKKERL